mmetsp:Transcript_12337/g.33944  ORF Transcript_12337/g.33944 Transcript_12337/m.33944 type:complete len:293 (-) Transcript_12337:441-1319(-)
MFEELDDFFVGVQRHVGAAHFEEVRGGLLPKGTEVHLLFFCVIPGALGIVEVLKLKGENHCGRHVCQAKLRLCRHRWDCHCNECPFAHFHLCDSTLEGIADIATTRNELQHLGGEPSERRDAVSSGLHRERHLPSVLRCVVALAQQDGLLHHRPILRERNILRLVYLLQGQVDDGAIWPLVTVSIILGAPELSHLAPFHTQQGFVNCFRERSQRTTTNRVVPRGFLVDVSAVHGRHLHRHLHLVAFFGSLPASTFGNLCFDHPAILKKVVLRDPTQEFDLENQRRVWWNIRW